MRRGRGNRRMDSRARRPSRAPAQPVGTGTFRDAAVPAAAALRARGLRCGFRGGPPASSRSRLLSRASAAMSMSGGALERLCRLAGIAPDYVDVWGAKHTASEPTLLALLRAMGVLRNGSATVEAAEQLDARRWLHATPPVAVVRAEQLPYRLVLHFPEATADETQAWRLVMESGDTRHGEFRPRQLELLEARSIGGTPHLEVAF